MRDEPLRPWFKLRFVGESEVGSMLLQLKPNANVEAIKGRLTQMGLWTKLLTDSSGAVRSIEIVRPSPAVSPHLLETLDGVEAVLNKASGHPLLDELDVADHTLFGLPTDGSTPLIFAGPCSVDDEARLHRIAADVAKVGAQFLRGGAYKPRTSPYEFSGVGQVGLKWLREAADANGLKVVTEVMSEGDVERVGGHADMFQIGSRNMQNFALLRAAGQYQIPVLLKRGRAATIDEWIFAGEHCMAAGAPSVIFCERGVRGFDTQMRNLLDLGSVAVLRHQYKLPVIVDPSHATGRRDLIRPLAKASFAAGACGVMVEYHPEPEHARSDAPQAVDADTLWQIAVDQGLNPHSESL